MATVRYDKKRRRYIADYFDGTGARRQRSFKTKREANEHLISEMRFSTQARGFRSLPVTITLKEYAERWHDAKRQDVRFATHKRYGVDLRHHIFPGLGHVRVRDLTRPALKIFLRAKLTTDLSRGTVSHIRRTLHAILSEAVEENVILANPAAGLGRSLRLTPTRSERQLRIKAMDTDQLTRFLKSAQAEERYFPLFLLLARTGMRLGEALGLEWADLDLEGRNIRVERSYSHGRIGSPKGTGPRQVDMSQGLSRFLQGLQVQRKRETLRQGWSSVPAWVFCNSAGKRVDQSRAYKAFKRALRASKLPGHFSPHCLRHTFASLLLQQGESPAYVQRQLGHASIQLTVDTYGHWLPMGKKSAVDRLEQATACVGAAGHQPASPADGDPR